VRRDGGSFTDASGDVRGRSGVRDIGTALPRFFRLALVR